MPSFMRLGSWNIVMFVTFEQLKKMSLSMKKDAEEFKPIKEAKRLPGFGTKAVL